MECHHGLSFDNVMSRIQITEGRVRLDPNDLYTLVTLSENGNVVAFAILTYAENGVPYYYDSSIRIVGFQWSLEWIQTNPLHQGKGYGQKIINYLRLNISGPILLLSLGSS